MTDITMSTKEVDRISILEKLKRKEISQATAAFALNLTTRQVRRILKRYREHGAAGLVHQARGRISNRSIDPAEVTRAISIVKKTYHDFGPTFALEKLQQHHGVTFGVDTLRKAMIQEQLWIPHPQKTVQVHQLRERRECEGELVQIDGSPYRWFEDRGNIGMCTLLVATDDATSNLEHLLFVDSESTQSYFTFAQGYLEVNGKPLAWYSDKHGVLRKSSKQGESCREDSMGPTQFGRAMIELTIAMIYANSPQAKGRVERSNQTLQDRLVKELRLRGINDMRTANRYLPEFKADFNRKFGVVPKNPTNVHRPLTQIELDRLPDIFLEKYSRTLSKNLTIHYRNMEYQITTTKPAYTLRHAKVEVWEDAQGNIQIVYQGKKLPYQTCRIHPKAEIVDTKQINTAVNVIKQGHQSYFDMLREQTWENYVNG
jgi:transposase